MKKIVVLLLVTYHLSHFTLCAQGNLQSFLSIATQAKMTFQKPLGMKETAVISNDELNYQYAVKDSAQVFEIRYLVYPLQDLVKKYNSPHPDTGMQSIDPNMLHTNLLLLYSLKIQGKEMSTDAFPAINEINHATCDLEFNADWAAEVNIQPCDEFGQKYKYSTILELHKDNAADAFVIFMYDNKETFDELVKPVFHNLKFVK